MNYVIKIKGKLGKDWSDWFADMEIVPEGENTILKGYISDQSALHGILDRIRDLNLTLISVNEDLK